MTKNICVNGMGRIGRAIFRLCCSRKSISCVHINEPFASIDAIVYFLKYDSLYGKFNGEIVIVDEHSIEIVVDNRRFLTTVSHYDNVSDLLAGTQGVDCYIDATGNTSNYNIYKEHGVKCIFTCCLNNESHEIIDTVNDLELNSTSSVLSASICDAVAIAPVLKAIYSCTEANNTIITTMHPALGYQKVIDNYPGRGINKSLGRQYIESIIPKRTSVEGVLKKFFPSQAIRCMSFRIPTESVCVADITIHSNAIIDLKKIVEELRKNNGIEFSTEDLVSIDFKGNQSSACVDMRWTEIVNDHILKLVIWYDNEFGYSSRLLNLVEKWENIPHNEGKKL